MQKGVIKRCHSMAIVIIINVSKGSESGSALFHAKKPPKIWSKAPQFETFPIGHEVENDPPNHFYCIFM